MKLARHVLSPLRRIRLGLVVPPSGGIRRPFRLKAELRTLIPAALAAVALHAQPAPVIPERLDLPTAIGFALQNNFAIRQARERIKQQEGVVVEVSARQIPSLAADASYTRNDADLIIAFPPSDQYWQINLTASQVLYAGGGVRSAIRSSKLAREAAILDLQAVINEALLQVRTAFYTVLVAREQIKVQESNLDLLQQQLRTATDRFEAGTVSSFERLRAEVAMANAQVPLITARNDYRLAIESLRQVLGFTTQAREALDRVPELVGTLDFTPVQFELASAFEAARANRPDLERLARLAEASEAAVTTARSAYYPSVSAFGGWAVRKGMTNSFGDSDHGWLVGVQSQWAIFDGRATAGRVAQARSVLELTRLSAAEARLAVDVEVRRAFSEWQQATELADASQRVVEQATEAVRLANARYSAGTGTQLDVLQAQVELTTARTNQIQAFYRYNVAVASLRKAIGQADDFVTN
jgi:outer membrane protein